MKGTRHFSRLSYNVARGLREIVAPIQNMPNAVWDGIVQDFGGCCVFCGQGPTRENRGIVPDHLIPVTKYGELVLGNTVPACQTCNDSRGDGDWREFLLSRFPNHATARISMIETHLAQYPYEPLDPEQILSQEERAAYGELLANWDEILRTASDLYLKVKARRGIK